MGVIFKNISSYTDFGKPHLQKESSNQVFQLAKKVLQPVLEKNPGLKFNYFIVTTSCPDALAPSIGQALTDRYNKELGDSHLIDMVQGCAGGVNGMILASKLVESGHSPILLLSVDAAKKATSSQRSIYNIFGNGSFACIIQKSNTSSTLLHSKSKSFKGLSKVVEINLGHDADTIILNNDDIRIDPRLRLGLNMNKSLAIKLLRNAEKFYNEFVEEASKPDILILHQVNPKIISTLSKVFSKYEVEVFDVAEKTGNCGSATTGIAFHMIYEKLAGKKVMICGFGTGGVISAGLWQF